MLSRRTPMAESLKNRAAPEPSADTPDLPRLVLLGACGCGSGCSCGCQSGGSCQCGGSCG
ncbi:hypothetical protein A7J05_19440 [Streptomyces alfalfae]|uniref:Metallothionein n=2 Tax=Streptomyces alfalfae TaxID=1642299 RepID=A0ABN4VTY2_9ACTN|nr:hypothetical protein A7J05_19440 [Streptomyces alfalfae]KUL58413.1 hypothetical protein ADL30_10940 [Streptomyces sp. NRRL S-1521]